MWKGPAAGWEERGGGGRHFKTRGRTSGTLTHFTTEIVWSSCFTFCFVAHQRRFGQCNPWFLYQCQTPFLWLTQGGSTQPPTSITLLLCPWPEMVCWDSRVQLSFLTKFNEIKSRELMCDGAPDNPVGVSQQSLSHLPLSHQPLILSLPL